MNIRIMLESDIDAIAIDRSFSTAKKFKYSCGEKYLNP